MSGTPTTTLATTVFTVTVTDNVGATSSKRFTLTMLIDDTPPMISSIVDRTTLWPPNHRMVLVAHDIGARDAIDPNPTVTVTVTSNEPINGLGDGDAAPDWLVTQSGGKYSVEVRAERRGAGSGRTYTILITATDASRNTSTRTLTVTVPKSQGCRSDEEAHDADELPRSPTLHPERRCERDDDDIRADAHTASTRR